MAKLTRKSYQRKAMVVGATAFAGIALVATGFAAWVISSSATKNVQGNVQVGTISEKSIEITGVEFKEVDGTRNYFSFEPAKDDNTGRVRCDGTNSENLSLKVTGKYSPANYVNSFSIALRMGTVADNVFEADTDAETRLTEAETANYITLPACWKDGVTVKTNAAGIVGEDKGMTITVAEESGKKVATFTYTIFFAWGSHFNNMNPSLFYDSPDCPAQYEGDGYKTDLIKFYEKMAGVTYDKDHPEKDPFKTLNFAILVTADTSGAAA